jgi:twitching motility protein PilT
MTPCTILDAGLAVGASDWLFQANRPLSVRVSKLIRHLPTVLPEALVQFETMFPSQFSNYSFEYGEFRFRANRYTCQGCRAYSLRLIEKDVRPLASLHCPPAFSRLIQEHDGLVIITGATGSGKSTTQTSVIDFLNHTEAKHITTIEDPIEHLHTSDKCRIDQSELFTDYPSYTEALTEILRQIPDYIVLGELRDYATFEVAINAAETGHLVFATMHTGTADRSISRILDMMPPSKGPEFRSVLAQRLRGVLAQKLVVNTTGKLIPVFELLLQNLAVHNAIKEGTLRDIRDEMRNQSGFGMRTFETSLEQLFRAGEITRETALSAAPNQELLSKRLS